MSALAGLMSWFAISVTYLRFRGGMEVQGFDRSTLPYKSVFAYWGAWYAIVMIAIISLFSAWTVFLRDSWDTATFITSESDLPLLCFFLRPLFSSSFPICLSRCYLSLSFTYTDHLHLFQFTFRLPSSRHLPRPLRGQEGHLENDLEEPRLPRLHHQHRRD